MIEINEIEKICITLCYDIDIALDNFLNYYDWKKNVLDKKQDYYFDLYEQLITRITKDLFKKDNIEVIYINDKLNDKLVNIFINLIRKEIYNTGLKIFFNIDEKNIYIWYENSINNEPYYIEDEKEKQVLKSLNYKTKYDKKEW